MPVAAWARDALRGAGRVGIAFVILVAGYLALGWLAPGGALRLVVGLGALVFGVWLAVRLLRMAAGPAVWRLRNRLLVTYLFIAVVPIVLIAALALAGAFSLTAQFAIYLVTSELDRRVETLRGAAEAILRDQPARRPIAMERIDGVFRDRYPGLEILMRDAGRQIGVPENDTPAAPPDGWRPASGLLLRAGSLYIWCHVQTPTGDVTMTAPLTREFLGSLVPNLGVVDFSETAPGQSPLRDALPPAARGASLPPAMHRLDKEFLWFATEPVAVWDRPNGPAEQVVIVVRTRVSAVLAALFNRKADLAQMGLQLMLIIGAGLFLIVELISLVIGISMTRTITGAVHRLYEGTQRAIEGDFTHRIEVIGNDQLADLSQSFNRMTEHMERLLVVAKEKERLQSEIEIAREVQNQLYPREAPQTPTLRLQAICQPARMVSGDYYDYETIRGGQVALAIGDVAGKGISAALLMATLQSSLRTQLQSALGGGTGALSTSVLVSCLNNQLYAYTSPEKYATFCLGIYDGVSGEFTYTNAGHLPPILVRDGVPERLDVNGTVVGAFPFSKYDESRVTMNRGDLLVCFTDGVTEPENEYGEMFGEDRLTDLVSRNAYLSEEQIIELVIDGVRQWTASEELQDDMTMLLARRI